MTKKLLIEYLCMVGLPLVTLLGVLHAGRSLTAPPSVDGSWQIEAAGAEAPQPGCEDTFVRLSQPAFRISQSGQHLTIHLNNKERTTVPGILEGETLRAGDGRSPRCSPASITVNSRIEGTETKRMMAGAASSGCEGCAAVPFRAYRIRAAAPVTGHGVR